MTYTNFCCKSGGSNLNAGTRTGDTTEPGTSADFTYASGNWVQSTGVFTVASGNPASDGVGVGDFASVYADGSTVTGFVGRVTARDATTITVSLTAKSGTAPTDGTGNRTLKIGGAWAGPNGTEAFPLNFAASTMVNATGNPTRVNFKNAASFAVTAATTHTLNGPSFFQGYTSSYGDGGKAILDGGTSGASYALFTPSGTNVEFSDLIFQNNGASGSAAGVTVNGTECVFRRVVVNSVRGIGMLCNAQADHFQSEYYGCNQSNTAEGAGANVAAAACLFYQCIFHDNTGSNNSGLSSSTGAGNLSLINCIFDSNGQRGANYRGTANLKVLRCEFYNNGADGLRIASTTPPAQIYIKDSNFVKNGTGGTGYGINPTTADLCRIINCGFGAGTQANTSGTINTHVTTQEEGSANYANDVTPWVDPANGDFRINLATAKGAGSGDYTQTAASYAGTVGYPDRGAAQHIDSGGGIAALVGGSLAGR